MDFPYTVNSHTKLAELQILKPEKTKSIRPVDIAVLNLLTEHDNVVAYINALIPRKRRSKILVHNTREPRS